MNGNNRADIKIGAQVKIVLKADQATGKLTEGTVAKLLTNSAHHPHGIKVRLTDGQVGRVQEII
ncbi:YwbE family protein [Sedimentibacter sp. zth1]|uniref:YwbE family protein n=1 Tax=Sedimentibacter sp. zth1 TaxID=2816908 RepID=UPI001A9155BB|nr:YwbE family protein [Sedimentibacter sp. zth1]QSX05719.1 YwbE family protein [Sedimentibacter sp. zth1]